MDAQAVALWATQAAQPPPDVHYLLLHDVWKQSTLRFYEDQLERLRNSGVEASLRNAPNAAAVSELSAQRAQLEQVVTFMRARLSQIDDEHFDTTTVDATCVEMIQLLMILEERRLAQILQLKRFVVYKFMCIVFIVLTHDTQDWLRQWACTVTGPLCVS